MSASTFLRPNVIVGALPVTLTNGTTADATQVMSNLNWLVNQVNANAAPLANTALLNANNNFSVVQSGIAATAAANFPIASQVQNWAFNTLSSAGTTPNIITPRIAALPLGAYASGQVFTLTPGASNLPPVVGINIDGRGGVFIMAAGSYVIGRELSSGVPTLLVNDVNNNFSILTRQPGLVLLDIQPLIGQAAVDFTACINSMFDEYLVVISGVIAQTDNTQLYLRVSEDGGATFKAGGTDYAHTRVISSDGGAPSASGSTGDSQIIVASAVSNTKPFAADVRLYSPSSSVNKLFQFSAVSAPSGLTISTQAGAGVFKLDTNPITAIRFLMNSGNMGASGRLCLYGVRKQ